MAVLISKEQFNEGVIKFIYRYNRLPYLPEDDVEIEVKEDNGEIKISPYRASKYIKEYYDTQDKMIKELLNEKILTYEIISKVLDIRVDVLKNMLNNTTKNPDVGLRRRIHIFFNHDFYKHLGRYNDRCSECRRKCKQNYSTTIVQCPIFKAKKKKKK